MKITKIYCDLCKTEIDGSTPQSSYEYWLPTLNSKDDGKTKNWPTRYSLCPECTELIKETMVTIKAEADLKEE